MLNTRMMKEIALGNICSLRSRDRNFCRKCARKPACWFVSEGIDRYLAPRVPCTWGCRKEIECEDCSENV
jgi:hypothetical protein